MSGKKDDGEERLGGLRMRAWRLGGRFWRSSSRMLEVSVVMYVLQYVRLDRLVTYFILERGFLCLG